MKAKKKVKHIWRLNKKHKSSIRVSGFFKYSYLSILRGGFKTLLVIVLISGIIVFVGQLTNTINNYSNNIETLIEDTNITAQFTDIKGRQVNKVNVEAFQLKDFIDTGYIGEYSIYRSIPYYYLGKSKSADTTYDIGPLQLPKGSFAFDRFMSAIKGGTKIVYTNNLMKSPEFYYSNQLLVEYLEGYNESMFSNSNDQEKICLISSYQAKDKQLELGDTIKIYQHFEAYSFFSDVKSEAEKGDEFKIVGIYESEAQKSTIYIPMNNLFEIDQQLDEEEYREYLFTHVFDGGSMVIKDASQLDEFRSFLGAYGISEGTRISTYRNFVVINDKSFISTLDTLNQQLKHLNLLYPILYVLLGIISFIVALLVIVSRQKELSIMRGLGSNKMNTLKVFLSEQVVLCSLGWMFGSGLSFALYGRFIKEHIAISIMITLIYLGGVVVTLMMMNRKNVMKILKAED